MSSNYNPKASTRIVFREEGDEALLFDPDTGAVKVLNETGKFIWSNLDGSASLEILVQKIMDAFDTSDENKIKEDLEKFIAELKKLKFLDEDES
ncbi:MAG: PqqD family protein [Candidatus Omnitrophota bacterium]|nr:PqqD family protein [Candidatus Omnitrophota bacterium]